jgi:hypothetical protein
MSNKVPTVIPPIVGYPQLLPPEGGAPNLIVVGASDSWSRRGLFSPEGPSLVCYAPGKDVSVAKPGTVDKESGTSFCEFLAFVSRPVSRI